MAPTVPASLRLVENDLGAVVRSPYVARLRWRCDGDPDWEIDTRHPGFETWREAACFANGLSEDGASMLFLQQGALVLQLVNGRDELVSREDAVIWQRAGAGKRPLPSDAPFVRVTADLNDLSALGLDGVLSPMQFGVDDIRGAQRLDVRVEADTKRQAVIVSLAACEERGASEMDLFEQLVRPAQA
jgi:hypothetical protein